MQVISQGFSGHILLMLIWFQCHNHCNLLNFDLPTIVDFNPLNSLQRNERIKFEFILCDLQFVFFPPHFKHVTPYICCNYCNCKHFISTTDRSLAEDYFSGHQWYLGYFTEPKSWSLILAQVSASGLKLEIESVKPLPFSDLSNDEFSQLQSKCPSAERGLHALKRKMVLVFNIKFTTVNYSIYIKWLQIY